MKPKQHVTSPPAKPLVIYDGDCNFCRFWIERWDASTEGRVEFIASQEPRVEREFPELPRAIFVESVQLIETDGAVYHGADAAMRALAFGRHRWPLWAYRTIPGVKPVTESLYRFVASHRVEFSFLTRLLWGLDVALPKHQLTSWLFLRLLGLIYLAAFLSLGSQIIGLVGHEGILPAGRFMHAVGTQFDEAGVGIERYLDLPTLCWFGAGDGFLRTLCVTGAGLSVLVIANVAPAICLFLLWAIYLSLVYVCQDFLGFQWDVLLLEAGFLAIFLAPLQLLPKAAASTPSRTILWLQRWLLFRLMFESGLVKRLSHDVTWGNRTALNYHYFTQPLPTWIAWHAQQLPQAFQRVSVSGMFIIELYVPFLFFAPRRVRFVGCVLQIFLQLWIFATGNYCFFNLLTVALCVLLLDDAVVKKFFPRRIIERLFTKRDEPTAGQPRCWSRWIVTPIAIVILAVTTSQLLTMTQLLDSLPGSVSAPLTRLDECVTSVSRCIRPFCSVNTYGLFAMMTTSREEIVIEGSNDGKTWLPYEFKYKPGDLTRRPRFVAPHQPRLDWQMWFAALGDVRQNPWFANLCVRLLQGSPDVLRLFARNPFPNAPPRYIRAELYDYHFSTPQEKRKQGIWWTRELKGEYLPEISLRQ